MGLINRRGAIAAGLAAFLPCWPRKPKMKPQAFADLGGLGDGDKNNAAVFSCHVIGDPDAPTVSRDTGLNVALVHNCTLTQSPNGWWVIGPNENS